jgi:hypothetical protein
MMFYNGFNLMIDIFLIAATSFIVYRNAWWDGYRDGIEDTKAGLHDE